MDVRGGSEGEAWSSQECLSPQGDQHQSRDTAQCHNCLLLLLLLCFCAICQLSICLSARLKYPVLFSNQLYIFSYIIVLSFPFYSKETLC